jgi:hypothetical protein
MATGASSDGRAVAASYERPGVVSGRCGLPLAALAAVVVFQALRVPVGRASSWLLDR